MSNKAQTTYCHSVVQNKLIWLEVPGNGSLLCCIFPYDHVLVCLDQVLEERIPFLLSSVKDFQHHVPNGQDSMVSGLALYQPEEILSSWAGIKMSK